MADTLAAAFQASVARVPDRVALRTPGGAVSLTWAQYGAAVERVAGAFAGLGVRRGDRIALWSHNRPELGIASVGAAHLGAAVVAPYVAAPPAAVTQLLGDSEPRVLVVESRLEDSLRTVDHGGCQVVALDSADGRLPALSELDAPARFSFEARWRAVQANDLLAILYTSGTTGTAKGIQWPNRNALLIADNLLHGVHQPDHIHEVSFLPFAHAFDRTLHWRASVRATTQTFCAEPSELPVALRDARPTFLGGPPSVWEGLKATIEATIDETEQAALDAGITRIRALLDNRAPLELSPEQARTLARLRARLGLDRLRRALTAAAPCPPAVHEFMHGLGLPFGEFWGMSEIGVATMTDPGVRDIGTLGRPLSGYELRIAPATGRAGEILVRTRTASRGYRNRPQETAAMFPADGWIRTGDLGMLDEQGRLLLMGRVKELIITSNGHNVAPAPIESQLINACPLIAQACLVGDGRPQLAVLITLHQPEHAADPAAHQTIADALARINATLDPREQIRRHAILPERWQPGDELTETHKLRRQQIAAKYAAHITSLYAASAQSRTETAGRA
ncbi:MAG: AMP-binding protein [Solirubrobacterales bacterium]|nr:AMP-binding protein [Solirubrobacterales bacterium]